VTVLQSSVVWVPAYCCDQLLGPFEACGVPVRLYDVRPDLSVDWDDLRRARKQMGGAHALVVVDYFGIPVEAWGGAPPDVLAMFDIVIRDAAQSLPCAGVSLLSGARGGYVLYSLRKPLPVPEVALLYASPGAAPCRVIGEPRAAFVATEIAGLVMPPVRAWGLYRRARQRQKSGRLGARPAALSRWLVCRSPHREAHHRRRHAGRRLLAGLAGHALVPAIPDAACPYYFPIRAAEPARIEEALMSLGIETTRFWRLRFDQRRFAGAREVADSIVCLPVHQDLTGEQVEHVLRSAVSAIACNAAATTEVACG
jgi:hypothetical protein